jgi:SRSO17 transposase
MLGRAHAAGVPLAWVTADSVHGAGHALRRWLRERGPGYVLAVTGAQRLGFARVEARVAEIPAGDRHRLSAGDGAKGPRPCGWAWLACGSDAAPGWEKGLLIRRSLAQPHEPAFHLTHATDGAALADLAHVAGARWTIEARSAAAKGEVGLDQHEVRSWTGWHRHVTLAMLAHAYLAALRKVAVGGRAHAGPGGRPAPAHRAGGPPPAPASRPAFAPGHRGRARLVTPATTPPAARPALSPATANLH